MLRYSIIIVIFIVLLVYLLRLTFSEHIQGRLRVASLILLGILIFVLGAAVYSNYQNYAVETVQEEFLRNRQKIIKDIQKLYTNAQYTQARRLAQKYLEVHDPELKHWFVLSKEGELNAQLDELPKTAYQKRLSILEELEELTRKKIYRQKMWQETEQYKHVLEQKIKDIVQQFSEQELAQKVLGYTLLLRMFPQNASYKIRYERLYQEVMSLIEDSPWNTICPSPEVSYCEQIGLVAYPPNQSVIRAEARPLGPILGVSWRPQGTLVSRNGSVAPEDGYYYLVAHQDQVALFDVDYVRKKNPFEDIFNQVRSLPMLEKEQTP